MSRYKSKKEYKGRKGKRGAQERGTTFNCPLSSGCRRFPAKGSRLGPKPRKAETRMYALSPYICLPCCLIYLAHHDPTRMTKCSLTKRNFTSRSCRDNGGFDSPCSGSLSFSVPFFLFPPSFHASTHSLFHCALYHHPPLHRFKPSAYHLKPICHSLTFRSWFITCDYPHLFSLSVADSVIARHSTTLFKACANDRIAPEPSAASRQSPQSRMASNPPEQTVSTLTAENYVFPRNRLRLTQNDPSKTPLLLIACGSYSPVTHLHLRMFEMASDFVRFNTEFELLGGYFSPVSDSYKKAGLASAVDRSISLTICMRAPSNVLQTSDV